MGEGFLHSVHVYVSRHIRFRGDDTVTDDVIQACNVTKRSTNTEVSEGVLVGGRERIVHAADAGVGHRHVAGDQAGALRARPLLQFRGLH